MTVGTTLMNDVVSSLVLEKRNNKVSLNCQKATDSAKKILPSNSGEDVVLSKPAKRYMSVLVIQAAIGWLAALTG
jgi:hypothetical protein